MHKTNKKNLTRQIVTLFDEEGKLMGHKNIFHRKYFNYSQFGSHREFWLQLNKLPKALR